MVVIDPTLREYTSLENMRKLFLEQPLPFEVVASDVIRLLEWNSEDFTAHTGLGKDTYFRITKGKQHCWDPDTIYAFCKGAPIGPLLAIYLLGKAHIAINPWVDADSFDDAYMVLMK
ncbi:hypothetical protein FACS1894184_21010 [Clostridia bacterium]|nr:hypothetical protein FACS1894184_21010 [Clostridia bacterium]GHU75381.1 hypothetical protein AGMMS49992_19230 [Clostridia bacterium]